MVMTRTASGSATREDSPGAQPFGSKASMPDIVLVGLNHETAPVEIRECIAFSREETEHALDCLIHRPGVREAVLVSTCNRVEVLAAADDSRKAVGEIKRFISEYKKEPLGRFEKSLYVRIGEEAVRHLFRVASSLDSMMLGEPQILGQVKEAYRASTERKTSGVILNKLLHRAFFVAKRIRTETGIGDHAVSISYAAVELGKKIFGSLEGKKVLLIGAGEMAELAVEHLARNRAGDIYVANRTFERAVALARQFKGSAVRFEEILDILKVADIIIGSTGADDYVVCRDDVKKLQKSRKNRLLYFIDIAVPRNIDPNINQLDNTYVYDIDDLQSVIAENIEDRQREAAKGGRIVDEAVIQFRNWQESLHAVPTIVALREKLDKISRSELEKTLNGIKHFSDEDREALERMIKAVANKFLHEPTLYLKKNGCRGDRDIAVDLTRKMFKLDED